MAMMLLSFGLVEGEVGKPFVGDAILVWREPGGDDACGMLEKMISA
jgi:hypothetical protein